MHAHEVGKPAGDRYGTGHDTEMGRKNGIDPDVNKGEVSRTGNIMKERKKEHIHMNRDLCVEGKMFG